MAPASLVYRNPVWLNYLADPFVWRVGDRYFACGTGSDVGDGREADGKIFPLLQSSDLVHWTYLGGALEPLSSPNGKRIAYWAPEVAERDGTFFMYYAADMRLRVATSDRAEGPYHDLGIDLFPNEPFSIDAHPFYDRREERWYLFFAKDYFDERVGTGTAVVPLSDDMATALDVPRVVVRASSDWQIFERNRRWYDRDWPAWHTVEGPFVIEHGGLYYCLYSGGCWEKPEYGVSFAVADHPLGPWRDEWSTEGPTVLRGIPDRVLGPGHNSVVVGPDRQSLFIVYHAWDVGKTARRMCIDPLIFTPSGLRCAGPTTEPQVIPLQS